MNSLEIMSKLENIDIVVQTIKLFFLIIFTCYTFAKTISIRQRKIINVILSLICISIISIITKVVEYNFDEYLSWLLLIFLISLTNLVNFKKDIVYSTLLTIISLSINLIIYVISVSIAFIPIVILKIQNDYIGLVIIIVIYSILIYNLFKIKRLKYGISFLNKKLGNTYFNTLILNIGVVVLFLSIILQWYGVLAPRQLVFTFVVLSITMFLTIKQSFEMYYKQNLLAKDLKETKAELESKKQEIAKLEKENLEFSKTSHSLSHKQKALEYKLDKLMRSSTQDAEEEKYIRDGLEDISKQMYKEPQEIELSKTDIPMIDNMLLYMQSECIKNNIRFELQISGNIHYLINNLISENDLEVLIADHIKDAIIAINYSDNSNRSILVRLGKINDIYGLYIYDSGVEFTKEVIEKLGKEPITTHVDNGGTGMGFMNTFDTLNRYKASMIIDEIGSPSLDNYTKVVMFKFDNKNKFKVTSYRNFALKSK